MITPKTKTPTDPTIEWLSSLLPNHCPLSVIAEYIQSHNLQPACRLISITGTNGKGSCTQAIYQLLAAAGYRVGQFTSPHMNSLYERIKINEQLIEPLVFETYAAKLKQHFRSENLTFFGALFLIALHYFNEQPLDFMLLEVGFGGRYDYTNLFDAELLVISSIGLDHTQFLGTTRDSVAWQKAGLMRPQQTVICSEPNPPSSLLTEALKTKVNLLNINKDYRYLLTQYGWCFESTSKTLRNLPIPRLHLASVAAALCAIEALNIQLSEQVIVHTISQLCLPGRQETFQLPQEVVLDVAHNNHAIRQLLLQLPNKPGTTILACRRDKDLADMIKALAPITKRWVLPVMAGSQFYSPETITQHIREQAGFDYRTHITATPGQALDYSLSCTERSERVLVCGSFILVAAIREHILTGSMT